MTHSQQPVDLLGMHSTADFSRYPKTNRLSKNGSHHRRLYSKAYNSTFNGISKILWTVTITEISFSVVRNTYHKFFFRDSNSFKQSYYIIRTITLVNLLIFYIGHSQKKNFLFISRLVNVDTTVLTTFPNNVTYFDNLFSLHRPIITR